nr:hypothetical protein [Desulfobacula sp.]
MIVSKDTNPEKDLYYIGARVIEVLASRDGKEVDYVDLLSSLRSEMQITNNLYALSLDWLFLLGAIELNGKGNIQKCF